MTIGNTPRHKPPTVPTLPDGRPRILFCGATTLDTIFLVDTLPTGPGKVLPKRMIAAAHGMAASAATAAARLGAEAVLFSRLGEDETGRRICDELTGAGVECSGVRRFAGVTSSISTVIVEDSGERLVLPFYDPALPADPGWLPLERAAQADAVLVDVRWPEGAAALLDAARAAGKPAVLDADVGAREVLLDLARRATHVVFSEPGACIASGKETPEAALASLANQLDGLVAVTLGARGCIWIEDGETRHAPGHAIRAVDTLAAGDIFHGAFTWALSQRAPLQNCMDIANAAAAIKCQTFGGRLGAPDRADIIRFLQQVAT